MKLPRSPNTRKIKREVLSFFSDRKTPSPLARFLNFNASDFDVLQQKKSEQFWCRAGERRALTLFHRAAVQVPAYRDFLRKQRVPPESIQKIDDFRRIPLTDKKNYIEAYDLAARSWNGELTRQKLIAVSSGTTGAPTYWPRGEYHEAEAAVLHELLFTTLFRVHERTTLALIGFPMGVYVSGIATTLPLWLTALKYPGIVVMAIGNQKGDMLRAYKAIKQHYDQVLLIGHPFFIKDVVETGAREGIDWSRQMTQMFLCSGGFNETWRDYVMAYFPHQNSLTTIVSVYGSSELLLMAFETPLSLFIRRRAAVNEHLQAAFTGGVASIPSIFQYNPIMRYIESQNGELIFTAASGVPLVRYNMCDRGTIVSFYDVENILNREIPNWRDQLSPHSRFHHWVLPFVTLEGRSDYAVVFYAANIYPEHIRHGLDHKPFLASLTGKFVMQKNYDKNVDETLTIYVELSSGTRPTRILSKKIEKRLVSVLREINLEYLFLCNNLQKDLNPTVTLCPYGDPVWFPPGVKTRPILSS